jgi:hypothetical protein
VAEVQPLASEPLANGVATTSQYVGSTACRYTWGAGIGRFTLDVLVTDASRWFPGMTPDVIKKQLQDSVKAERTDALIADVGEVAVFNSDSPVLATTTALVKGRILKIQLDGLDAREKRGEVIELLKSAASRL